LPTFLQGSLEKQLLEEVAKVLEVYNENVRGIDKLNNNMMTFMNQLLIHLGEQFSQTTVLRALEAHARFMASGNKKPATTKATLILGE
jgi:predicted ATPase